MRTDIATTRLTININYVRLLYSFSQHKPVCSSLEPLAHGEVDEEVDAAVDDEAEVADSKHGAEDVIHVNTN